MQNEIYKNVLVTHIDGEECEVPMYAGFVVKTAKGWLAYAHKAPSAIRQQGPYETEYRARLRVINSGTWWINTIPQDQLTWETSISKD